MNPRPLLLNAAAVVIGSLIGFGGVRATVGTSSREGAAGDLTRTPPPALRAAATIAEVQPSSASPLDAMEALANTEGGIERDHAFYTRLQQMSARELSAGSSAMLSLLKEVGKHYNELWGMSSSTALLAEAWIDRWLELDTAAALSFLSNSEVTEDLRKCGALPGVWIALARREPEWAKRHVLSMETGKARELGVFTLVQEAAKLGEVKARSCWRRSRPAQTGCMR
jgi:hypothetical protein